MAYVLDPAKPEDEKDDAPASAYGPLLAGAGGAPTGGAAAGPAPRAAPTTPGFVNFDRILNANKSVADRMVNDVAGGIERKAQNVASGIRSAETDLKAATAGATVAGPAAGTRVGAPPPAAPAPTTTAGTQAAALNPGGKPMIDPRTGRPVARPAAPAPAPSPAPAAPTVTADEARKNAGASYTGPSTEDVRSRYGALLGDLVSGRDEAIAAGSTAGLQGLLGGNALDASLANAVGAPRLGGLKGRFDSLGSEYGTSLKNATNTASSAAGASAEAVSKWQKLIEGYDADQTNTAASREQTRLEIDRKNAEPRRRFDAELAPQMREMAQLFPMNLPPATLEYVLPRLTPQELDRMNNAGGLNEAFNVLIDIYHRQPHRFSGAK